MFYKMSSTNYIVFLVPGFPQDENDSTCIPALQLYVRNFKSVNQQLKIIIIAFQYPFEKKEYYWNGIKVYSACGKGKGNFFRLLTWIRVIKYFLTIIYKNRVKGIHSFWLTECAFVGQLLSRFFNIPHIASLMGQDAKKSNNYLKFLNLSKLAITSGSNFAVDVFKQHTCLNSNSISIIPFGVECLNGSGNNNREIDLLGVGSLIPLKNYNLFIEIVNELVKDFPSLNSVLIGDGGQRSELENSIAEKNLLNNISLTGKIHRNEVLNYMRKSKILLHTSLYESQGLVFLEALLCGLYVVSFNVGYLPKSTKVFLCSDKNKMINDIKDLLGKEKKYNKEIYFTIEDTIKKFNDIYSTLGIIEFNK
jgi:glycosyltransferase involved in cell wall biosynthesis